MGGTFALVLAAPPPPPRPPLGILYAPATRPTVGHLQPYRNKMSNARKVAGGGGVGVEGESGLGIESVKIKRYGLTMDSKIIQNLKQPFRRKKKRAKIKYIGVFGHLFKR